MLLFPESSTIFISIWAPGYIRPEKSPVTTDTPPRIISETLSWSAEELK